MIRKNDFTKHSNHHRNRWIRYAKKENHRQFDNKVTKRSQNKGKFKRKLKLQEIKCFNNLQYSLRDKLRLDRVDSLLFYYNY